MRKYWEAGHPYRWRTWIRTRLPWFLINLGVAAKGRDCETAGGEHHWYNRDGNTSGCYHCEVIRPGRLWERDDAGQKDQEQAAWAVADDE